MKSAPPLETAVPELVEGMLAAEMETGDRWDLPPELFVILDPSDEEPSKYRVAEVNLSPDFWSLGPFWSVLTIMGRALRMPEAPPFPVRIDPGDRVLAVMTRTEGYALVATKDEDPEKIIDDLHAKGQGIADHPDGREVKSYIVVTEDRGWSADFMRGDEKATTRDNGVMEGRVPDAMREILASLKLKYPTTSD